MDSGLPLKRGRSFYAEKLEAAGFARGVGCSVVFYNEELDISCEVQGDDFTFCGYGEDLKNLAKEMESWFELKVRAIMGKDPEDDFGAHCEVDGLGHRVRSG